MAGTDGGAARVAVVGRPGCGRRTVAQVLAAAGLDVIRADQRPDVDVYVLTETLKPEDRAALTAPDRPCVAVLNKADLTGFGGDGPMAAAARHCARLRDSIGVPLLPLAALSALAGLDDSVLDADMLAALRVLTTEPANLASTDGFVTGTHRLSMEVRTRLLAALDLFGIAHAVRAVRSGADAAGLRVALRRASAVDEVLATVGRLAAAGRYRRLVDATTVDQLGDEVVVTARMNAAMAVLAAEGVTVGEATTAPDLLRRALTWQRYSRGPMSRLHQACGADIVRGSLRLWERAGGVPEPPGRRHEAPEPPA
ncbi:hypothetical protein [Mycobacterium sp. M26]|uniref:hypothetical protein n=1 Tax=Mycobacterium sp. M26 TaxID=1762962 RepID=UPI0018D2179C|nr:hypothetical protein [Mycobacterium sp. M26]